MAKKSIAALFPELFPKRHLGVSIGDGWRSLVIDACQQIKETLTEDEIKEFHWNQIKQKLGGLRMYYSSPVKLRERIDGIINVAEKKADRTCEDCGGEGRLYPDGYLCVLCDTHAMEQERIFPRVYGEPIECRHTGITLNDRKAICTHALYFKNTCAKAWFFEDDPNKRQFIFLDDLPKALSKAFLDTARNVDLVIDQSDEAWAFYVDDFLTTINKIVDVQGPQNIVNAYFKLPEGARCDTRTQLERDVKDYFNLDVKVTSLMPLKEMGGFAVGKLDDETSQLFRVSKDGEPEEVISPRHNLDSAILNAEKLLKALKAARALFEGSQS